MDKRAFLERIKARTGMTDDVKTQDATKIVLTLLSHRITEGEAKDVSSQLTKDMKGLWEGNTWITEFLSLTGKRMVKYHKKEELYSLVENELKRRGIVVHTEELVNAVFRTLKEQISEGEVSDIGSQLPPPIKELWAVA